MPIHSLLETTLSYHRDSDIKTGSKIQEAILASDKQASASDLNHNITNYRPVYPGDTLYLVTNSRHFRDLTPPEGSTYRSVAIQSEGSIYNQRGEKVSDVIFRVTEGERIYKEGKAVKNPTFADTWEAPDWMKRPVHYYTDKDWEFIKDIWSKEKRQGATPLY